VEAGPLLLANWVDYTDPENYKKYTASVGPKVTVDGYGSNDELLAKLSAGGAKFDLVAPTGYA
jgi:spermidine/putrescine transport system substrate-binding protein